MFAENFVADANITPSASVDSSVRESWLPLDGLQMGVDLVAAIEAQLSQSEVYSRAVGSLQQMTADHGIDGQILLKAVSLEAIRLTLQAVSGSLTELASPELRGAAPSTLDSALDKAAVGTDAVANNARLTAIESDNGTDSKSAPNPLAQIFNRYKVQRQLAIEEVKTFTRAEMLIQIGSQIQLEREHKGLTIAQLHTRTFIPIYHLQALENGHPENLPEDIYLRGFLHRIEHELGLAEGSLTDKLPGDDAPTSVLPCWAGHGAKGSQRGFGGLDVNPMHLYMTYAAIIVGGVYWLSNQTSPQANMPDLGMYQPRVEAPSSTQTLVQSNVKQPLSNAKQQKSAYAKSVLVGSAQNVAPPELIR
jgi:hypothetical protein